MTACSAPTLPPERRLAAYAAIGLFFTLFLPWYHGDGRRLEQAANCTRASTARPAGMRSRSSRPPSCSSPSACSRCCSSAPKAGRSTCPAATAWVITAAGVWTCVLIVWRIFDKQGGAATGSAHHLGSEWGIFVALGVAALLTYAGSRIRAAHEPRAAAPREDDATAVAEPVPPAPRPRRRATDPRSTAAEPRVRPLAPGPGAEGSTGMRPPGRPEPELGDPARRHRVDPGAAAGHRSARVPPRPHGGHGR